MIEVSIIVPVYNAAEHLSNCLDSLISQTLRNIEIILINDGSTDRSDEICRKYASLDARISYFCQENKGPSFARNIGINLSKGTYLGFCDADDKVDNDMYFQMVESANRVKADVVMCDIYSERDQRNFGFPWKDGTVLNENDIKNDLISRMVGKNSDSDLNEPLWGSVTRCVFRNDTIRRISAKFPNDIKFAEDLIFTLNVLAQSKSVVIRTDAFYHYTNNASSIMNSYIYYDPDMFTKRKRLLSYIKQVLLSMDILDQNIERLNVTARSYYQECIGNACRTKGYMNFFRSLLSVEEILYDIEVVSAFHHFNSKNLRKRVLFKMIQKKMFRLITIFYKTRFGF